ncbi:MAG: hypothetical protein M3069_28965 [Chloroflexota bacterium]|nr:hypothetical protein [Chloroflexota bacterium]
MPDGQPFVMPLPGGPGARMTSAQTVVDVARAEAAKRVGTTADQVSVISVQDAEWTDLSLGCPGSTPHMVSPAVVIPGFIVELDAAGTRLTYHTDTGLRAIACDGPPVPQTDPGHPPGAPSTPDTF